MIWNAIETIYLGGKDEAGACFVVSFFELYFEGSLFNKSNHKLLANGILPVKKNSSEKGAERVKVK